jgi:hypothetical protein
LIETNDPDLTSYLFTQIYGVPGETQYKLKSLGWCVVYKGSSSKFDQREQYIFPPHTFNRCRDSIKSLWIEEIDKELKEGRDYFADTREGKLKLLKYLINYGFGPPPSQDCSGKVAPASKKRKYSK